MNNSNSSQYKKIVASFVVLAALVGVYYLGFASGKTYMVESGKIQTINASLNATKDKPEDVDFGLFWKAWNTVNEKFVRTKVASTTTDKEKIYGAIGGMVDSIGDPYTVFFPPAEASSFESEIEGNFEGVGMEMGIKDQVLTVITPLKGSPAEKAGMRPGDKVIQIEGQMTTDFSIDQAVKLIRGKKGTAVNLLIVRDGVEKPIEVRIIRDTINLPVIDTKLDPKTNIFTIRLYTFSAQSASLFRTALRDFVDSKSNKLILDLRGNPGGFLDSAVDMASWFLAPGKTVVIEDYGAGKDQLVEKSRGYNIFNDNLKMVILIDGGSASASEILAGALSEYGKAKLVGTKSFGKGSVQEYIKLNSETALKVTVARWLTPNGKSISEGGLTPDVEVKLTAEDVKNGNDLQMQKAVELLK